MLQGVGLFVSTCSNAVLFCELNILSAVNLQSSVFKKTNSCSFPDVLAECLRFASTELKQNDLSWASKKGLFFFEGELKFSSRDCTGGETRNFGDLECRDETNDSDTRLCSATGISHKRYLSASKQG